mmetsp:Transcript_21671/g.30182  ORF Transcript_21671/g.30182 Transcript_21671/m.30182 type:complete len:83 (+) Transcript_21671:59-307(+)
MHDISSDDDGAHSCLSAALTNEIALTTHKVRKILEAKKTGIGIQLEKSKRYLPHSNVNYGTSAEVRYSLVLVLCDFFRDTNL